LLLVDQPGSILTQSTDSGTNLEHSCRFWTRVFASSPHEVAPQLHLSPL